MAKYLRSIACHFVDANGALDPTVGQVSDNANDVWPLSWMYETYATPLPTADIAKVNVMLSPAPGPPQPSEVLGIATVWEHFDTTAFAGLAGRARQQYYLERIHQPLLRCAEKFQWDDARLMAAYQRVIADNFRFTFFWKKPLASPDRRRKVQAFVDASSFPAHLYLVYFDAKMQEERRCLLSAGTNGPGVVEFLVGDIRWDDANTVRVTHANGRDYWLWHADGGIDFHYPRAERGDPHGEYDLGRMYYDGQWLLQDRARGLALIHSAAAKGFVHAVRFLAAMTP